MKLIVGLGNPGREYENTRHNIGFQLLDCIDILVIQDDLDMNLGRVKIVHNSSSGGHNGIKDIERCLGSKVYTRLKIGISNDKTKDTKDYVLGCFNKEEMDLLNKNYEFLSTIVDDFCILSLEQLMSKYNHK